MSRCLRGDHGDVHISRGNNASEMDIEAMREHEHVAFLQVRLDVLAVQLRLLLVIDQDHDDIRFLRGLSCRIDLEALLHGPLPAPGSLIETDDDMASGLLQVQRMCVSLASIADDRDGLSLQEGQITVFLIIDFC